MSDLLWSDPHPDEGWKSNEGRTVAWTFGPDVVITPSIVLQKFEVSHPNHSNCVVQKCDVLILVFHIVTDLFYQFDFPIMV